MKQKEEAKIVSYDNYKNKTFELSENSEVKKVVLKDVFNIIEGTIKINENTDSIETDEGCKIWVSISNKLLEKQINTILQDYKSRTKLIDAIVEQVLEKNINGIVIESNGTEDKEAMIRFVIELTPKLRELGITTGIVANENINKEDYKKFVDFIIE